VPRGWELNSEQVRYYCDAALVAGVELHDEELANNVPERWRPGPQLVDAKDAFGRMVKWP
jgi:hypothetical protein